MSEHSKQIAVNRKATHDYFIEQRYEAGLALLGWEVKSLREGRGQLKDSYVVITRGEAWLLNAHISPLSNVPEYLHAEPERSRKLLLHARELNQLAGKVSREGYTLIPLSLYWKKNRIKLEFGVAKGKKQHDKRESIKDKEWKREKERLSKHRV